MNNETLQQGNPAPYNNNIPQKKYSGFAISSMVCGICSLVTSCIPFVAIPLAALSILFVLLPHRRGEKLDVMGIVGIVLSIIAILFSIAAFDFWSTSMKAIELMNDPTFQQYYN